MDFSRVLGFEVRGATELRAISQVTRLFVSMSEHKGPAGKYVSYILAAYISNIMKSSIAPWLRAEVVPGLYALLDACGDHDRAMLFANLNDSSRDQLRGLVDDYNKYHKFQGNV